jgi:hypothetical protein
MATSTKTTPVARKAATTAAPKRSPRKTSAVKKAATPKRPAPKAAAPGKTAQALVNKPVKLEKVKKPKMIRDSFTIPKPEYLVLDVLKERAGKLARAAKKSELLAAVPTIKTGRPAATA